MKDPCSPNLPSRIKRHRSSTLLLMAAMALAASGAAFASPASKAADISRPKPNKIPCYLLQDPGAADLMDGLRFFLHDHCETEDPIDLPPNDDPASADTIHKTQNHGGPNHRGPSHLGPGVKSGADVTVNDSASESGPSTSQSETTLARNPNNGTLCSVFMDIYAYDTLNQGFTGFARSTDNGASFVDLGHLGSGSYGDPIVVWRQADSNFYVSTLSFTTNWGVDLYRSSNDCVTFQPVGNIHTGPNTDRPFLAVDNDLNSPFYGRLYSAYRTNTNISLRFSDNGGTTWSAPTQIGGTFGNGFSSSQGVYLAVVPGTGTLYAAFTRFDNFGGQFNVLMDTAVFRSTNGGASFTATTEPSSNRTRPREAGLSCGSSQFLKVLNGGFRHVPTPQIAVDAAGNVHIVYSHDPDTFNFGDVIDVFYRRSTNGGTTWDPQIRLNDDTTTQDQFNPTLSVHPTGTSVVATWYDRRNDPNNLSFEYFQRTSTDGGVTWEPNRKVSDQASPVYVDPASNSCYQGDYDQHIQAGTRALVQWSDNHTTVSGHPDPEVYFDVENLPGMGCCVSGLAFREFTVAANTGLAVLESDNAYCAVAGTNPTHPSGDCTVDDTNTTNGIWNLSADRSTCNVNCIQRNNGCPTSPFWNDYTLYNNDWSVDGDHYAFCALGSMQLLPGGGGCSAGYDATNDEWDLTSQDASCRFLCVRGEAVCPGFASAPFAVDGRNGPAGQSVSDSDYSYCAMTTWRPRYNTKGTCKVVHDSQNGEWDMSADDAFCRFQCIEQ